MNKESTLLRKRFKDIEATHPLAEETRDEKHQLKPFHPRHFLALSCLCVLAFVVVIVVQKRLPKPLMVADERENRDRFISERAYNFLKKLTKIGPRLAGSYENEVVAVGLLTREVKEIIKGSNKIHSIELDVQRVSGDFDMDFLDGMTSVYRNVQNVVVRIASGVKSRHSLLVNCHFDSAVDSPGASDDGAGCAVTLETLRVLSRSPKPFPHNIIFLFNGAEENFMQASQGFITQHRWAKEVRAFVNLEACGAGGRELLFQGDPRNSWLLKTYSKAVAHPYGSSLSQEFFESKLFVGDTDYRIFRDFGNASGLDFAWTTNGYVYHTKLDTIEQVPMGSLQRTGDNIVGLVKAVISRPELGEDRSDGSKVVFFDMLGVFMVQYTMGVSDLVNLVTIAVSLFLLNKNVQTNHLTTKKCYKNLLSCTLGIAASWIISITLVVLIALWLTILGKTMSWFARPWWLFVLYVVPTVLASMVVLHLHSKRYLKNFATSPWTIFRLYRDAYHLIWTIMLIFGLLIRTRSSFIILIWGFFASVENFLETKFGNWKG